MEHNSSNKQFNSVDDEFKDLVDHGDDFLKVELLRPARDWYKKALELNLETDKVKQRIEECDKLLAFERKVIWMLVALAALVVAFLILFFYP